MCIRVRGRGQKTTFIEEFGTVSRVAQAMWKRHFAPDRKGRKEGRSLLRCEEGWYGALAT